MFDTTLSVDIIVASLRRTARSVGPWLPTSGAANKVTVEGPRIFEIAILLLLVIIVVPPERLPEVMRTAGRVLRELRLASNTVMRELTTALDDPFNSPSAPPHHVRHNSPPPRPAIAAPAVPNPSAESEAQK